MKVSESVDQLTRAGHLLDEAVSNLENARTTFLGRHSPLEPGKFYPINAPVNRKLMKLAKEQDRNKLFAEFLGKCNYGYTVNSIMFRNVDEKTLKVWVSLSSTDKAGEVQTKSEYRRLKQNGQPYKNDKPEDIPIVETFYIWIPFTALSHRKNMPGWVNDL